MTLPSPLGPLSQLDNHSDFTAVDNLVKQGWFSYEITPAGRGGEAGRWANVHLKGAWTFVPGFGRVFFYIQDAKDAMLFKLTWV